MPATTLTRTTAIEIEGGDELPDTFPCEVCGEGDTANGICFDCYEVPDGGEGYAEEDYYADDDNGEW